MTENSRIGREPIEIIEIDQDFCGRTYGVAPCTASLVTGGDKCFNTRSTCQDPANYDRGTLTLRFCNNQARIPQDGNYYLPFLSSVKVTPGRINPGGGSGSSGALGLRSTLDATFTDHPHNDRIVDPYVDDRSYAPFERATFWTKWRARNPFYTARAIRHISGYLDDTSQVVDSITRTFFIEKLTGPGAAGAVKITAKDVLSLAQGKKAKAPFASTGKLLADITAGAGALTLTPSGIGDDEYPNSGYGRIGGEVVEFTRATGSDVVTLTTRGGNNTTAAAHTAGDVFQLCLEFDGASPPDILYPLLNTYAGISAAYLDYSGWVTEAASYLPRLYSALITEPTDVNKLIDEISEQMYFYTWWDERADLVKIRAVRPAADETVYQLDKSRHLIADSVNVSDMPDQRLTQVWVFHALRDPTKDLTEAQNYGALEVISNDKGNAEQFGTEQVKVIYSRWITATNGAAAVDIGNKYLARYGNVPKAISFALDAKDRDVWVGSFAQVTCRQVVDTFGVEIPLNVQVLTAAEQAVGTTFAYMAQQFTFENTPNADELTIRITADTNDVNLRGVFDDAYGVEPSGDVRITIASNVLIGSTSTATAALTIGDWPTGVVLYLDIEAGAYVAGKGGDGGDASGGATPIVTAGGDGGDAIDATGHPITIDNLGIIGGGGGGAAGAANNLLNYTRFGGGGGAGNVGGAGGSATDGTTSGDNWPGADGALEVGGRTANVLTLYGIGGDLGQDGTDGGRFFWSGPDEVVAGGTAGNAVTGVSNVTYVNKGDVRGPEV